jgi:hypothetical protein
LTGSVTAAALARKIDTAHPTLLLDESDAAFKGDPQYAEALRGVLNTGFKASGTFSRCHGPGFEVLDFSTYCAKAIAGIGSLPDTVASRSIPIRLKRKSAAERTERFRLRKVQAEGSRLRDEIRAWAEDVSTKLDGAEIDPLEGISDRSFDVWEPLLAIAEQAGGDWPRRARTAAQALSGAVVDEDESLGVRLLADCRTVFGEADRIATAALRDGLNMLDDSPWGGWNHDNGITNREIAKHLRPFEISSNTIREQGRNPRKGYYKKSFEDPWARYLHEPIPSVTVTPTQPAPLSQEAAANERYSPPLVTADELAASPHQHRDVTDVTPKLVEGRNGALTEEELHDLGTCDLAALRRKYECGE